MMAGTITGRLLSVKINLTKKIVGMLVVLSKEPSKNNATLYWILGD